MQSRNVPFLFFCASPLEVTAILSYTVNLSSFSQHQQTKRKRIVCFLRLRQGVIYLSPSMELPSWRRLFHAIRSDSCPSAKTNLTIKAVSPGARF